jgi:hypothetical protein
MALQTMEFKFAKLSVVESTLNKQQIATNANLFVLFGNFIIVLPPCRCALFKRHRLMPVPVFLSRSAAGVILAEQDRWSATAGIGFVRIADADWLDRLDRLRPRSCRAHTCRRMRIAQGTMNSRTGRRRSLLFAGGASCVTFCDAGIALISTRLCVATLATFVEATAPYGVTSNIVQGSYGGKTSIRQ